jgi:hypothetical protein
MNKPDIIAALIPLVDTFRQLGINYHIGGSIASSAYGIARATLDIDVVADLSLRQAPLLTKALEGRYYIEEQSIADAVRDRSSFNIIHLDTIVKIDVFIVKNTPYDRCAFNRKRPEKFEDDGENNVFFFASCEDVILHKLQWFLLGEGVSERQWLDVLGIIKVQKEALDLEYLRQWAADLDCAALLEKALTDAGICAGTNHQRSV